MTKVEAIRKLMEDNDGTATWDIIYSNIEKYYPAAKEMKEWQAGIRGVLYREIKNNRNFKKIGFGIFALKEYEEEKIKAITEKSPVRMHSFIEGICLELGNFEQFDTYTPDPTATFKDNILLSNLRTMNSLPLFTYQEIVEMVKRIDVLWFNKKGFKFPKRAFEVVDSIGTLGDALTRTYQLVEFDLDFHIIGSKENKEKFKDRITKEPFIRITSRYKYQSYEEIIDYYNKRLELENLSFFK
jgi:hypothetical protein